MGQAARQSVHRGRHKHRKRTDKNEQHREGDELENHKTARKKRHKEKHERKRENAQDKTHPQPSTQIFFVQRMDLPRQIRPTQRLPQFLPQPPFVSARSFPRQPHLPPQQIIQQPHVGLDQHGQSTAAHDQIRFYKTQPEVLHHVRDGHRRTPRHPNAAVNQHAASREARFFDPGTDGVQLGLEGVDAVIADALDIEDLDPAFTFLDPERALVSRALRWGDWSAGRICEAGRTGRGGRGRRLRRGYESTLANGNNVCDSQGVEHIYVRGMVTAYKFRRSLVNDTRDDVQVPKIQKWKHTAWEAPIKSCVIKPRLMIRYERWQRIRPRPPQLFRRSRHCG